MTGLHNFQEDFVYRALRTDEDPYRNIVCKDPRSDRTINQHVKNGLILPSKYISTTASFELAQRWIGTSAYKSNYTRGTTIVQMDVSYLKRRCRNLVNSAYDFTKEDVRNTFLTGKSQDFASTYEEIVFEECIPVGAICDIHVAGKGWIGTQRPRSVPTPIPTQLHTATPLPSSTHASTFVSTTPTIVSSTVEYNDDTSSLNTTISSSISSPSTFCVSDISNYSIPSLDTSADTSVTITPLKRSTGVKRSCDVDSDVTPAKYVRVDIEGILSADDQLESNGVTPSSSVDCDTPTEEVSDPAESNDEG